MQTHLDEMWRHDSINVQLDDSLNEHSSFSVMERSCIDFVGL